MGNIPDFWLMLKGCTTVEDVGEVLREASAALGGEGVAVARAAEVLSSVGGDAAGDCPQVWTVIGVYDDTGQVWADSVLAADASGAFRGAAEKIAADDEYGDDTPVLCAAVRGGHSVLCPSDMGLSDSDGVSVENLVGTMMTGGTGAP